VTALAVADMYVPHPIVHRSSGASLIRVSR
jgi:hypothetical protein